MSYIGNQPTTVAFVTDQFSGNGSTTAFTMSVAPANTSSILVAITGVVQDPSTYSVAGTTLTFSAAPPSGTSNISVRYLGIPASGVTTTAYRTVTNFTATAGQTTFSTPSYTVGYIDVYRNGARLGSADFTATSGTTVILTNPATAGDLVVTESFYVSSVLNAIPATAGAVNSTYIANGAVGSSALASGAALANIGSGGITQSYLATGTASTGPSFYAYLSSNQSTSNGVATKVLFDGEIWDTASCYSSGRFTPNVAGYYTFTACIGWNGLGNGEWDFYFAKNGATVGTTPSVSNQFITVRFYNTYGTANYIQQGSWTCYLNGTTDYVEVYAQQYSGTISIIGASYSDRTFFTGSLVRAA